MSNLDNLDESDSFPDSESNIESDVELDPVNTIKKEVTAENTYSANNLKLPKLYSDEEEDPLDKEDEEPDDINAIIEDEDDDSDNNSVISLDNDSLIMNTSNPDSQFGSNEQISPINSDVESEEDDYLQKFNVEERNNYINKYHPECLIGNSTEIENLTKITRDANNNIIDDNHKTQPFLSKYEKTKVLGQRASQINMGAKPYITVPTNMIDGYLIAQLELKAKKIPVIIRRPLPNRKSEYWKLFDLEQL